MCTVFLEIVTIWCGLCVLTLGCCLSIGDVGNDSLGSGVLNLLVCVEVGTW